MAPRAWRCGGATVAESARWQEGVRMPSGEVAAAREVEYGESPEAGAKALPAFFYNVLQQVGQGPTSGQRESPPTLSFNSHRGHWVSKCAALYFMPTLFRQE